MLPRRINMTNSTDTDNIMTSPYFVYFIKTHLLPKKIYPVGLNREYLQIYTVSRVHYLFSYI